jgi:hypothetical protein
MCIAKGKQHKARMYRYKLAYTGMNREHVWIRLGSSINGTDAGGRTAQLEEVRNDQMTITGRGELIDGLLVGTIKSVAGGAIGPSGVVVGC